MSEIRISRTFERWSKQEDKALLIGLYNSIVEPNNKRQALSSKDLKDAVRILHKMARYKDCFYFCNCCS